jgi:fucose 4-O-acetylase-like acetyltransferase
MNLIVLIVPFIVYCVIMYVYKLNMREFYSHWFDPMGAPIHDRPQSREHANHYTTNAV